MKLWSVAVTVALGACVVDVGDSELETSQTQQTLSDSSATFQTRWMSGTNNATTASDQFDLGIVPAGTTLRLSTCGEEGGYAFNSTYMRLYAVGSWGKLSPLSEENIRCPGETGS